MNIGQLARQTGVTPDTLRFYEREGLLATPVRAGNGYRRYAEADVARVRFVRSAQALGFSLNEIRGIVPRLAAGLLDRAEIEQHLRAKMAEIDAHMRQLRALKRELQTTFDALRCAPGAVSIGQATAEPATAAPRPARGFSRLPARESASARRSATGAD